MLECCARLLEPRGAFLVLNLYSMGLSATLASTAVRQAFGTPFEEQFGELCFDDRAGKRLPWDVLSFCQVADDRFAGTGQSGFEKLMKL